MAKIINIDTQAGPRIITLDPGATLKTHNQGMNKPTQQETSSYVERQPSFREAIGKDVPSAIAMGGSFAGPVGGAAGSFIGEGLRQLAPEQFGGGSVGEDLAFNAALPGLLGSLNKFAASPRAYLAEKLASRFGQKLPPVKNLMQASSEVTPQLEMEARDARLRGFNAPEPNFDDVTKIIQKASDNAKDTIKNPVLRYARNSLIFRLGVLGGLGGVSPVAAGVGATLTLGEEAIKQLVKDPATAQLVIKAVNTPGSSEQAGLLGKTLLNSLRGVAVTIKTAAGDEQPAIIDNDGKLVYKR